MESHDSEFAEAGGYGNPPAAAAGDDLASLREELAESRARRKTIRRVRSGQ